MTVDTGYLSSFMRISLKFAKYKVITDEASLEAMPFQLPHMKKAPQED